MFIKKNPKQIKNYATQYFRLYRPLHLPRDMTSSPKRLAGTYDVTHTAWVPCSRCVRAVVGSERSDEHVTAGVEGEGGRVRSEAKEGG